MSVHAQIWSWAQQLKPWQSDLVRRLCASTTLTQSEMEEVTQILLATVGILDAGQSSPTPIPLKEEDLPRAAASAGSARISSLSSIENVGALEPGQNLGFELRGLTVVYGDNGAGKSSYARVLKEACRASDRSTKILPNVFASPLTTHGSQGKAKIEINENGVGTIIERVANTPPSSELSSVSVFDSGCANVYLSSPNAVAYIPQALSIFKRLSDIQEQISTNIQSKIDAIQSTLPRFPEISTSTKARAWIDALSDKASHADVRAFTTLAPEEREHLKRLEASLQIATSNDPSRMAALLRRQANEARKLKSHLESLFASLADDHASNLRQTQEALALAQAAADALSQKASTEATDLKIGNPLWKSLWAAANAYCEAVVTAGDTSPLHGDQPNCPLCQQPLGEPAQKRFQKIQELTSGLLEKELIRCRAALTDQVRWLKNLPDPSTIATGHLLFSEAPELELAVTHFLNALATRKASIENAYATGAWGNIPELPTPPTTDLQKWAETTEEKALKLDALAQPAQKASAEREYSELNARNQLFNRLDDILRFVDDLKKIAKFKKAQTSLSTKGITTTQTKLMDTVVTDELRKCLASEITALKLDHLQIKMSSRGTKGKTVVELQLNAPSSHKLSEILSEGETRALTLAFFLAEVAAGAHDGGIIFDDPVSSLDHERREHVSLRLAKEADRRQVIVFTHDIVFLSMLRRNAEKEGVRFKEQVVRRSMGKVGVADNDVPWKAMSCEKQQSYLRNKIPELSKLEKSGDLNAYTDGAKNWLGMLRSSWERAVEDKLLGGVVSRFTPEVHTKKLTSVRVTGDLIKAVNDGMTTCSNWVHDQALAINAPPPNAKELEAQLNKYKEFLDQFKGM